MYIKWKEYHNYLYLLGYTIDKDGINHPIATGVGKKLKNPVYQEFFDNLQGLFIHNGNIYLLSSSGSVYRFDELEWRRSNIQLQPDSAVVYSGSDIIACRPSDRLMASSVIGSCYSKKYYWNIPVKWIQVAPAMCDGYLLASEKRGNDIIVKKIEINSGRILAEKKEEKETHDLCSISFKE